MFPIQMSGTWNYTFNGGSGDLCGTNSELNICDSPDTSTMTYNYTACSTVQAYSGKLPFYFDPK